jgi:hypothetical protein
MTHSLTKIITITGSNLKAIKETFALLESVEGCQVKELTKDKLEELLETYIHFRHDIDGVFRELVE